MRFHRPSVEVPGDNVDISDPDHHIMQRMGEIIGYDHEQGVCLWRFGFLPGSRLAEWSGVHFSGAGFLWVRAERNGTALDTFTGYAMNLPKEYDRVIDVGDPIEEYDEIEEVDPFNGY